MSGFALCLYAYTGPDSSHVECAPGDVLYVHQLEDSGWAAVTEYDEGRWGWVPSAYIQSLDDEFAGVLVQIEPSLRLGAYRAMTAIHAHATDDGYSSPDSAESDALGDEWAVDAPKPKHRRPSRAPASRPSLDSEPRTPTLMTRQPSPGERAAAGVQFVPPAEGRTGRSPRATPTSSSSFVPPRVRAFRLRSKSHDRNARSDSESASRPRRPSVSLRRTRMSMFGPGRGLEPSPAEEIARLAARPWYLQPKHTPATGEIVIDPDGSIRAGTLEAITERLTCDPPSRSYEHAFRRAVLMTYEAFTTSNQLFELLTDQYVLEPPRQLTEEQFTEWKEARLRPTQARVLDVLGMWIALPRLYKDDPEIMLRIREFLQFVTKPDTLAAEAKTHLKTIDKLMNPLSNAPRPAASPRRKGLKPRPFPSLSPGPGTTTLLSPRVLPDTALSTSPRLEIPLSELDRDRERDSPLSRRKSHTQSHYSRDTISSRDGASMMIRDTASVSSHSSNPTPQPQRSPAPSGIINIDPTALAHHLTLLEAGLYMRVKRSQCLEWHRAGKSKRVSMDDAAITLTGTTLVDVNDLREFCATNDRLAAWVKWTVLSQKTSVLRAEAVGIWVRVAEKCRILHNISSLCAIVAGLTSSDITRLNVTASSIPANRAQRLNDLQRLTSPAGNFAALKVFYAGTEGPGVPFVGMYLTALVHASDQFKDVIVAPEEKDRENGGTKSGAKEEGPREPPTPTATSSPHTLLNFTKRHKQADIIGAMLKFQAWPYTVVPDTPSSSTNRHMSSSPPTSNTLLTPSTSPTTSTTSHAVPHSSPPISTNSTWELYPYPPSTLSPTVLYASTGGVAWLDEQLSRATRITLGSDWTYERSMRLLDEEAGWTGVRAIANEMGF
ncbi:Ras guanine nucleotide exchange factor [Ceratobasidium sp. AG-Ba]|nr:Ras guanine nucleotide exchange factor [Ceratobasidium sp. AG-Ba]QRW09133.1 Ras guanine nucleotide exchange factor [Ceratobasidium sp. AG-Ba]